MATTASNLYGTTLTKSVTKTISNTEEVQITGFNYPIEGRVFGKAFGINLIRGQIRQLFNTAPGERVMLPKYGLNLKKYLFKPLDDVLMRTMRSEITEQINLYVPNAKLVSFRAKTPLSDTENSSLTVSLTIVDVKTNEIIPLEFTA